MVELFRICWCAEVGVVILVMCGLLCCLVSVLSSGFDVESFAIISFGFYGGGCSTMVSRWHVTRLLPPLFICVCLVGGC